MMKRVGLGLDYGPVTAALATLPATPDCLPDTMIVTIATDSAAPTGPDDSRRHLQECLRCLHEYLALLGASEGDDREIELSDMLLHPMVMDRMLDGAMPRGALHTRLTEMLAGCRKGDGAAWEEFLRLFSRLARRALRTFLLTALEFEEVEDSVRVNMIRAITSGRFDDMQGDPALYIYGSLRNAARDALKRRQAERDVSNIESRPALPPLEVARLNEQARCVQAQIREWNASDRFIFIAKVDGVPSTSIKEQLERAFNLHLSVGAVDVRFSRLRSMLRKRCA